MEEPENTPSKESEEPAEASLDELIAKKADETAPEEETEEESMLEAGRDEKVEALSVKVVPQQPTEFVCKSCFLVKHQSQLADKKRMYCVDCA